EAPLADVRTAVGLAVQMASGLVAIHDAGIVHRDLKPANVLLDAAGKVYLTDFGLARLHTDGEHLTFNGDVLGTPAYMAPEQALGEQQHVGPRSDLYSVGVILFQMLTGQLPFPGKTKSVVLER